jgi:hypothetical protein
MVELENGDRTVEIERDVLELHCFLMTCVYALFRCAEDRTMSRPYLIFRARLSMLAPEHLPATGRTPYRAPKQMETSHEYF